MGRYVGLVTTTAFLDLNIDMKGPPIPKMRLFGFCAIDRRLSKRLGPMLESY